MKLNPHTCNPKQIPGWYMGHKQYEPIEVTEENGKPKEIYPKMYADGSVNSIEGWL